MPMRPAAEIVRELLLDPEGRRSPYPLYHELRDTAPVHENEFGSWMLSRFDVLLPRRVKFQEDEIYDPHDREAGTFEYPRLCTLDGASLPSAIADDEIHRRLRAAADSHHTGQRIVRISDSDLDLHAALAKRAPGRGQECVGGDGEQIHVTRRACDAVGRESTRADQGERDSGFVQP